MNILKKWKAKNEIKEILKSNDKEKLESVKEFDEDENLENIILSIRDRSKRAQALEKSIHKIDNKEVLKSIIPTLKDDDILTILENKIEYLDNDEINILYTTISGIDNQDKRIKTIKKFYKKLSDGEIAELLEPLKDKKIKSGILESEEYTIENEKINIVTNKIIDNYINNKTLLHMRELLGCMQLEISKVKVIEEAIKQEEKIQEKIKKGEFPAEYEIKDKFGNKIKIENNIFGKDGIKLLIEKSFKNIRGTKSVEKRKKDIIIDLYRRSIFPYEQEGIYSYEETRNIINSSIYNELVAKEGKEKLLKLEGKKKFLQEVQEKDLIDTPITIEETGKIVDISDEIEL